MRIDRVFAVVLAAAASDAAGTGRSAVLDAAQVHEAIRWGMTASDNDLQQYVLQVAPTWTVNFDTPFLRVAQLARAWRKHGRDIKDKDVPPGIFTPDVHVYALALLQPGVTTKVKSVQHVTIRTPGARDSIQPRSLRTNLNRARNRRDFGPAKIARSVHAVFDARDFVAGNELRVDFEDGTHETIVLAAPLLAKAR